MPGLASLVAECDSVLLIDSASARIQAGLWRRTGKPVCREAEAESGVAIFECVDAVLAGAGVDLGGVGAFVFCEGPGSILGIRIAAMALRVWRTVGAADIPVFAYRSLELVAHDLLRAGAEPPFAVIADARRQAWHRIEVAAAATIGPLQRVSGADVARASGELFMPAGFRAWAPPPRPVREVPYALPELWHRQDATDLLRRVSDPDACLYDDPAYVAWTPRIHRIPRPVRA